MAVIAIKLQKIDVSIAKLHSNVKLRACVRVNRLKVGVMYVCKYPKSEL